MLHCRHTCLKSFLQLSCNPRLHRPYFFLSRVGRLKATRTLSQPGRFSVPGRRRPAWPGRHRHDWSGRREEEEASQRRRGRGAAAAARNTSAIRGQDGAAARVRLLHLRTICRRRSVRLLERERRQAERGGGGGGGAAPGL